jgi:hypothetical protein
MNLDPQRAHLSISTIKDAVQVKEGVKAWLRSNARILESDDLDARADDVIEDLRLKCDRTVAQQWSNIIRVAAVLMVQHQMTGGEFDSLLRES